MQRLNSCAKRVQCSGRNIRHNVPTGTFSRKIKSVRLETEGLKNAPVFRLEHWRDLIQEVGGRTGTGTEHRMFRPEHSAYGTSPPVFRLEHIVVVFQLEHSVIMFRLEHIVVMFRFEH